MDITNMKEFDPTQYGATPVTSNSSGGFDPTSYGATPVDNSGGTNGFDPTKFSPGPFDAGNTDINKTAALLGFSTTANEQLQPQTRQMPQSTPQTNSDQGFIDPISDATHPVKGVVNPLIKGLSSALRSPIDLVRGIFGKAPLNDPIGQIGADPVHSIQSEAATNTGKVFDQQMSPGQATLNAVGDTLNPAATVLGGAELGSALKAPVTGALNAVKNEGSALLEKRTAEKSIADAKNILNPTDKYTPTEVEKMRSTGQVETKGIGPLKKDVVLPKTTPQHEVLAQMVDEGKISTRNTPQQNINAISQEARVADSNIDSIVNRPELNKPFNGGILNKVFDTVKNSAKKDLVFVSDSVEERAYNDVLDVAKEELKKNPYNSSGLRTGIKAFNARMQKILGSDIYSGGSESVGNARIQAAKDVRTALNNFLADNLESPTIKKTLSDVKVVNKMPSAAEYNTGRLQGGSVYKSQLQKEAQLLNARDELAYRSRGTVGKSKLSQAVKDFPKKHPVATVLGGAATGEGVRKVVTGNF